MSRSKNEILTSDWPSVALFAALLKKFGDEAGPACLVASAYAGAVIAMEVFMEGDQISPVRIILKFLGSTKDRPPLIGVFQEDAREPF